MNPNASGVPAAIVTGSSRGIGAAIALRLASDGYAVCVNYRTHAADAQDLVSRIEADGGRAIAVGADVTRYEEVERMVKSTAASFGRIRAVVNNAGLSKHATLEDLSIDDWNQAVAVNLSAAMFMVKAALPYLRRESWARVVNICSLRAMTGSDHGAQYAASKAGLVGLTKSLALELAPGITVNAVSPGYTRTDMTRETLAAHAEALAKQIPAGRPAEPEEIAALVSFLASEQAAYITGETINANGGIYMR
jgi:3-oxoacyl-[acyl-carrier protein] reductase